MDAPLMEILISILTLPIQLFHGLMWGLLDFLTFDVFQLGGVLPITL